MLILDKYRNSRIIYLELEFAGHIVIMLFKEIENLD